MVVPFLAIGAYDTYDALVLSNSPTHYSRPCGLEHARPSISQVASICRRLEPQRASTGVLHRRL